MTRHSSLLASIVLALSLALSLSGLAFGIANEGLNIDHISFAVSFLSVQIVGALLLARRIENPVGWVMSGLGLFVGLQVFVEGYAPLSAAADFPPGGLVLTWIVSHAYLFIFVAIALLFFLFPSGKLSHPRWKYVVGAMLTGFFVSVVTLYTRPGALDDERAGAPMNPYALDLESEIFDLAQAVGTTLLLGGVALSVVSLILRYRASSGVTRLQMKSFAAASAVFAVILAINLILRNFFALPPELDILLSFAFVLIPLSVGNAILRYRLYEIDVFINRALVYGTLSAIVVLLYVGFVFALQFVLAPITGDSDLAVAASTLAVAALFRPLRARVQAFIDRRFYRRKYDAGRTLAAFTSRLRDEVDVDLVLRDVAAVVQRTVQPAHVHIWLRTAAGR
jgi:hypothetical protein